MLKFKALINKSFSFTSEFKSAEYCHEAVEISVTALQQKVSCINSLHLNSKSGVETDHVAGYLVAKIKEMYGKCCKVSLYKNEKKESVQRSPVTRSLPNTIFVADARSLLEFCLKDVRKSGFSFRRAEKLTLENLMLHHQVTCHKQRGMIQQKKS